MEAGKGTRSTRALRRRLRASGGRGDLDGREELQRFMSQTRPTRLRLALQVQTNFHAKRAAVVATTEMRRVMSRCRLTARDRRTV
jgi:hypothetical protein